MQLFLVGRPVGYSAYTGEGVVIATQKQDSIDGFKRKFSSLNHVIFIIIA